MLNLIVLILYILYILSLIICLLVKLFIIDPWKLVINLKNIHGNLVYIYFYPLNGAYRIPYSRKYIVTYRPKCKAIVANHWRGLNITALRPELIKDLNINNLNYYQKYIPVFMIQEIERSILLTEGLKWKHQKQMIKILNFQTLKNFTLKMVESSMKQSFKELKQNLTNEYKVIKIVELGRKIQSQIAIKQFFCDHINEKTLNGLSVSAEISQFVEDIFLYSFQSIGFLLKFIIIGKNVSNMKFLHNKQERILYNRAKEIKRVLGEVVLLRIGEIKEDINVVNQYNLMDNLILEYLEQQKLSVKEINQLPKHKIITVQEVVEQSMGMYIAALDNAGVFLGHIMYCLARYPHSKSVVEHEIEQIFQIDFNQNNENLIVADIDKLNKLEKTNYFIKECFRLYNSSPGMFPRISLQTNSLDGIEVPKDSLVSVAWNTVNYNDEIYPLPYVFQPQRYEKPGVQCDSLTPFSSGRRNCIGENMSMMEIKILIVLYLTQFDSEKNKSIVPNIQQRGLTINPIDDRLVILKNKQFNKFF